MTKKPDLEATLSELEALVQQMETGKLSLEESLQVFEKGVKLTKTCQKLLTEAEQKVKVLTSQEEENA